MNHECKVKSIPVEIKYWRGVSKGPTIPTPGPSAVHDCTENELTPDDDMVINLILNTPTEALDIMSSIQVSDAQSNSLPEIQV